MLSKKSEFVVFVTEVVVFVTEVVVVGINQKIRMKLNGINIKISCE